MPSKTEVYNHGMQGFARKPNLKTRVSVCNTDTPSAASDLLKTTRERIFVLNFANSQERGGGYLRGAQAQEEDICRKSNLYKRLEAVPYPWASNDTLVYTSNVEVFRDENLERLPHNKYFCVDVISAAAPYKPEIKIDQSGRARFAQADDCKHMAEKIRSVLRCALHHDTYSGIVGAWGCGAFGGPAYDNALLWSRVLHEPEFSNKFDNLVFAVLGEENFTVFKNNIFLLK